MELTLKKVQQLDSNEILKALSATLNKIYQAFEYTNISKQEYYDLVLKEITNSKKTYNGDIKYTDFIKTKIKKALSIKINEIINNPETSFNIIDRYINQKYNDVSNYEIALSYFNNLNSFFNTHNFVYNIDLIIELINKNTIFSKMIKLIFNHYKSQIVSGVYEKIFNNHFLILSVETYCMSNNIEIAQNEQENTSDIKVEEANYSNSIVSYLKEIREKPVLSPEREKELARKIAEGDTEAKKIFIECNLKLVISIAKKYLNRGLSFADLIQEGNLGLMTAVDRYDVEKGYKFSTYATHWIKQSIRRALTNISRNIRVPSHIYERLMQFNKISNELEAKLNRKPTTEELANQMRLSKSEIIELQKLQIDTLSLNYLIKEDEDTELENFIPTSADNLEEQIVTKSLRKEVKELLEKCDLKEQEIEVLMLRNGFNNNEPMTLDQIGVIYNVTRERIRQIEAKALMKIRRSRYIKELADYMENPDKSLENIEEFREKYTDLSNKNKAFLSNRKQTEKEKDKMKKIQTIYELFNQYTKEQVNEMLQSLTEDEKELILFRYGNDLNNPTTVKLTKEQNYKFYGLLVPKMRRLLYAKNSNGKNLTMVKSSIVAKKEDLSTKKEPVIYEEEIDISKEKLKLSLEETTSDEITKEDYIKILELLKSPTFSEITKNLPFKEAIIISLRLGYVDGKYFSIESIAKFLNIEEKEVIEAIKKVLLLYKEKINSLLDNVIEIASDKTKVLSPNMK